MTFGQRVTIIRKQKNLTQTELATQIGTSGNIVSKYERDFITPSIEVAAKIAAVLGTSIDYLVTGALPEGGAVSSEEKIQLQQFDQLSPEDKLHVLAVVEAFVTKSKLQSVKRPSFGRRNWERTFVNRTSRLVLNYLLDSFRKGDLTYTSLSTITGIKDKYFQKLI